LLSPPGCGSLNGADLYGQRFKEGLHEQAGRTKFLQYVFLSRQDLCQKGVGVVMETEGSPLRIGRAQPQPPLATVSIAQTLWQLDQCLLYRQAQDFQRLQADQEHQRAKLEADQEHRRAKLQTEEEHRRAKLETEWEHRRAKLETEWEHRRAKLQTEETTRGAVREAERLREAEWFESLTEEQKMEWMEEREAREAMHHPLGTPQPAPAQEPAGPSQPPTATQLQPLGPQPPSGPQPQPPSARVSIVQTLLQAQDFQRLQADQEHRRAKLVAEGEHRRAKLEAEGEHRRAKLVAEELADVQRLQVEHELQRGEQRLMRGLYIVGYSADYKP